MRKTGGLIGATILIAALLGGGLAAPAQAGVGGCDFLAKEGRYVVGGCTANNPGPRAKITIDFRCAGERPGASHRAKIRVGYGANFRYDTGCWFGVKEVYRVR